MQYVLLGALGLGILLFVIGWLMVVVTGFQRHPLTGLIALLPGINILTLPSLWHKVSGWVISGFVGVLLAAGAWFGGANEQLYQQAQSLGVQITPPEAASAAPVAPAASVTHTIDIPAEARAKPASAAVPVPAAPAVASTPLELPPAAASKPAAPAASVAVTAAPAQAAPVATTPATPLADAQDLPASALYHVVFKSIAVSQLANSNGKYIRLVQKDGRKREGKINAASGTEITLEERKDGGLVTLDIKTADIREASIMTRKQGGE
ncbi:MAG: hypothetical protein JG718_14220 [Candidatus Thiothrix moscowensis]|nr:hypothetical protein [Candidatus Thiothrix moscowensis]